MSCLNGIVLEVTVAVFYRTKVSSGKPGSVFVMSKINSFGHNNYILTVIQSLKMTWS